MSAMVAPGAVDARTGSWHATLRRCWPWVAAAVVSACYTVVQVVRYARFDYTSFDLAIFTQAVEHYAHGQLPISTVRGGPGFDVLGDHFSPALAVLAPGYRLFPSPVYLLVCQAVLFGLSVVPIAGLASRRLGHPAAVLITIAYSASWGLQQAAVVDFHEVALAVPLLAAGGCALVDRRWTVAAAWLVPLVLVKEDLGATVAVAGLYMVLRGARRTGWSVTAVGIGATALEMGLIVPSFTADDRYPYWSKFGTHGVGGYLQALVVPSEKLTTLLITLGVTAFVCLRSPLVLLAVPTLIWRFESSNTVFWGHEWHYSAVLMPIVFVALVDALDRMRTGRWAAVAAQVPAVVCTIAVLAVHVTPLGAYLHKAAYASTDRSRAAERAVELVPRGAVVETDIGLMSHLTAGRETYFVGNNTGTITPDFVVTDQQLWSTSMHGEDTVRYAEQLHPAATYRVILDEGGITVVQRVPDGDP